MSDRRKVHLANSVNPLSLTACGRRLGSGARRVYGLRSVITGHIVVTCVPCVTAGRELEMIANSSRPEPEPAKEIPPTTITVVITPDECASINENIRRAYRMLAELDGTMHDYYTPHTRRRLVAVADRLAAVVRQISETADAAERRANGASEPEPARAVHRFTTIAREQIGEYTIGATAFPIVVELYRVELVGHRVAYNVTTSRNGAPSEWEEFDEMMPAFKRFAEIVADAPTYR